MIAMMKSKVLSPKSWRDESKGIEATGAALRASEEVGEGDDDLSR